VKWKQTILLAAVLLLGAFSAMTCSTMDKTIMDDDERPPIIVKNGSIDFVAQLKDGSYGNWVKEGTMTYRHADNRKEPKSYYVQATKGTCKPDSQPFTNVERIAVAFTSGGVKGAALMYIEGKFTKVFVGAWTSSAQNETLRVATDGATTFDSAELWIKGSDIPIECVPENNVLELKIFQKKQ